MPQSRTTLRLDELEVEVIRKNMKHVRVAVRPPNGHVRVSAPAHMSNSALTRLLKSKLPWIRQKRAEMALVPPPPAPAYVSGELHRVRGRDFRLVVTEIGGRGRVTLGSDELLMQIRPDTTAEHRAALLERWRRADLLRRVEPMLAEWQQLIGVTASEVRVRRMTTRWGSCSIKARRVWLNLELSARSDACLEYVLVHELLHLVEPSHGPRFWRLMDEHLPQWRQHRAGLKRVD